MTTTKKKKTKTKKKKRVNQSIKNNSEKQHNFLIEGLKERKCERNGKEKEKNTTMPRAEPGSLKAISNAMKAHGLQKLKWYCQMCEKQCRDENGFKCHCESESHQRQMALYAANTRHFMGDFSRRFEKGFMDIMRRSYRHTRVRANRVYNDYIQDRKHVHMNSTQWASLTAFIMYLGKQGKCIVEDTPKGWYLTYVEEDPVLAAKMASIDERERADASDEARSAAALQRRMDAVLELQKQHKCDGTEEDQEEGTGDAPASGLFKFSLLSDKERQEKAASSSTAKATDEEEDDDPNDVASSGVSGWVTVQQPAAKKPRTEEEEEEGEEDEPAWIRVGMKVRVKAESLKANGYYNAEGTIQKVIDDYVAEITLVSNPSVVLRVDQDELELV